MFIFLQPIIILQFHNHIGLVIFASKWFVWRWYFLLLQLCQYFYCRLHARFGSEEVLDYIGLNELPDVNSESLMNQI